MCLGGSSEMMKKKRGRPRKYGAEGVWQWHCQQCPYHPRFQCLESFGLGNRVRWFKSHNTNMNWRAAPQPEDVTMKVMTFSQQGGHAICILSTNGTTSNVTLRQPTSSGGTLTYEGQFEILSLSGSFMATQNGGTNSRSGGMSVSLAVPNGHVLGGLAGLLVAAGPVQVVVGSFLPVHQQEQKHKQQRTEAAVVSHTGEFKVSKGGLCQFSPLHHSLSRALEILLLTVVKHLQPERNRKATVYRSVRFPVDSICIVDFK